MKKQFILIHGAWHGAWCWNGVKEELESKGHDVEAPTLPGQGTDDDRSNIIFSDYINAISALLNKSADPVILVGHSSAGFLLQTVASLMPEKIDHLILINAFLLPDGKCQFDVVPPEARQGMTAAAQASPDNSVPVMEDFVRNALMGGESKETQDDVLSKLGPQPLALFTTPVETSKYDGTKFKTTVIFCNKDVSLPEGAFIGMAQVLEEFNLIEVPLGHEGLYTDPLTIAKALVEAVEG